MITIVIHNSIGQQRSSKHNRNSFKFFIKQFVCEQN